MRDAFWKYIVIASLVVALGLIAFLQFNAKRSISNLIDGNEQALNEFKTASQLEKLRSDLLTVESQIRGVVITQDSSHIIDIEKDIAEVKSDLSLVQKSLIEKQAVKQAEQLKYLVDEKIQFNQHILDEFYAHGKKAAEQVINTNRGKRLTDSILKLTDDIADAQQDEVSDLLQSNDLDSANAANSSIWLAIISGIALLLASFFVILRLNSQAKLIKQLDESHKRERQATELKDQFMANMSHEIRTPMNAIIGFTNLLQKEKLDDTQKQQVNAIQTSGENLLNIVNDILDFSKIEAGMMRLESVPFSLRGTLQDIEMMFREKVRLRGLVLSVDIATELPDIIEGDAVRLTQILVNLISNAIKFTDKGSISVSVLPTSMNTDKPFIDQSEKVVGICFVVKDTGIGIPKDKVDVIFDRFRQASSDITRRFGGSGLGLSIVKNLVELQGGTIEVSSVVDKGSTFTFNMPYKISDKQLQFDFKEKIAANIAQNTPNTEGVKVLVVEDNKLNQDLMRQLLTSWQLNFTIAENGRQAIEYLKNEPYNLILMDIQMPEMDGYSTTKKIRDDLKIRTPIVALTAHALAGERERCLSAGMNDYLPKPIREDKLRALIAQFVTIEQLPFNENTKDNTPLNGFIPRNENSAIAVTSSYKNGEIQDKILNLNYLQDLSKGNTTFVKAMLTQFVEQMPQEIADLKKAIKAQDFTLIKSLSHNMKTTVAFVGLDAALHPSLDFIENAALKQDFQSIQQDFENVKRLCEQAAAEIQIIGDEL
jgi:signal transduction histidine kinase/CheY-like chemotaxis protein/HPt (histidine-containing phosphotransfer) domain-containing protein